MTEQAKAAAFLDRLSGFGWFDDLPDGAARAAREGVALALERNQKPWVGLVCATPDSAYLLEDQPYTALLRQFAEASHGAFDPKDVSERADEKGVRFAFRAAEREHVLSLPADADDLPDSFVATINAAMKASGTRLRFLRVHDLGFGPIPGYTLADPKVFAKASEAGLVPGQDPSGELSEKEIERFAEVLEAAELGQRTFYWTIDDVTIAEAQVPGRFEDETDDTRRRGEGFLTILKYEGAGTMMFHCGPPLGEPFDMPEEFEILHEEDREDRRVRSGSTKMSGNAMAWRQDGFHGMPVHLGFCVTRNLSKAFEKALDKVRIFESSPERDAVFESCLASPPRRGKRAGSATKR
jgi:hypothetical protein